MPATHPAAPRTPRPAPRLSPRPASLARLRSPCGPTSRASTYNCHSAQCLVGHKEGTPERWVWREGDYFSQFHPRPPRREEAATRTADGMAGAPEERGPGPSAGEQLQQQHVACQVFPERLAQGKSQQGFLSGFFTNNQKCQLMLVKTLQTNPYVKLLLDAMKHSGCAVNRERHFSCEDCNGHVSGGFDASVSQVRAANLSGDCSLVNEIFRLRFGLKQHHQTCVRDRAILSILAVRNISKEVAQKAVDEVFESCFNDHEPFGRIPHNKTYARYAHRDFQNRDRYYSNI
ncbi:mitochondrial inner membrane protease ATP23 homolog isoform X2 [Rousettus aegyptiacus]|uniref:mitochondrial inner membrane protease ATP23 homolog isoform X2 n=1 Tax=Rousettus aegyptiacus TaxID=9407 RepID=UPI00168D4734|nr:mitochondrial inner membrane protease ATP23 homolog isoform X2 [Rousettus aegyptiacus]